jgi:DNA-binding IclR family transcriptional regulator
MPLSPLTSKTITDISTLVKELDLIHQSGFAISFGERDLSAAAIAVPIWGERQRLYGSLSISGPAVRFTKEKQQHILSGLWKHAKKLSALLGYAGNFWATAHPVQAAISQSNPNPQKKEAHP